MTTYVIDPYHIATMGVAGEPITIATDGFIVVLEEEIIPPTPEEVPPFKVGGGLDYDAWKKEYERRKKKKITVVVTVAGKQYKEVAYTNNINLDLKDVKVKVSMKDDTPKISIIHPDIK